MIKKGFLLVLSTMIIGLLSVQVVYADVVPLPGLAIGVGLSLLIVIGVFVGIIVLVSFLIIKGIKKKHIAENSSPIDSADQDAAS